MSEPTTAYGRAGMEDGGFFCAQLKSISSVARAIVIRYDGWSESIVEDPAITLPKTLPVSWMRGREEVAQAKEGV